MVVRELNIVFDIKIAGGKMKNLIKLTLVTLLFSSTAAFAITESTKAADCKSISKNGRKVANFNKFQKVKSLINAKIVKR